MIKHGLADSGVGFGNGNSHISEQACGILCMGKLPAAFLILVTQSDLNLGARVHVMDVLLIQVRREALVTKISKGGLETAKVPKKGL
eukprot:14420451-Alexandrium_andersonii.AAC.1